MKRVFLAGEGPNELGGWARERIYRDDTPEPGALEALMRRIVVDGWEVRDGCAWRHIPKLVVGRGRLPAEERNVVAAAQFAAEYGCDVVVFSRDRDRDAQREGAIARGLERARERHGDALRLAGGLAVECLEAWILAAEGERRTEDLSVRAAQERLGREAVTAAMVVRIEACSVDSFAEDAASLASWCRSVEEALSRD